MIRYILGGPGGFQDVLAEFRDLIENTLVRELNDGAAIGVELNRTLLIQDTLDLLLSGKDNFSDQHHNLMGPAGELSQINENLLELQREVREAHNRLMTRFAVSERYLVAAVVARLDEWQAAEVEAALAAVETEPSPPAEMQAVQQALHETLTEVRQLGDVVDRELARQAAQLAEWAAAPQLEAKHRLLVSIPIVPWLLSYESEFELKSAANLEAAWRSLLAWLKS